MVVSKVVEVGGVKSIVDSKKILVNYNYMMLVVEIHDIDRYEGCSTNMYSDE